MKKCPYCAEEIRDEAIVCRYCGRNLTTPGSILLNVTRFQQEDKVQRLLSKVFESTAEGILVTDADANIVMVNQAFETISGHSFEEVRGHNARLLKSGRHGQDFYEYMWTSLRATGRWKGEIWNRRKNGEIYLASLSISAIKNDAGEVTNYVGVFTDITARKKAEQRLRYLATHDSLTDLPNRDLFQDRLIRALVRAQRSRKLVAVLFMDLDGFKTVNDTYGHEKGDQLLQAVARRLSGCVRQSDTIARIGGDEFAGLIEDLPNLEGASIVAENILAALSRPFALNDHEFRVTASVGISIYPIDGTTAEVLLQKADAAMYRAKSGGKNRYQFQTPWK